jgi:hypothetical protein
MSTVQVAILGQETGGIKMTGTAVAVSKEQRVARPLRVLVPLIQDDLKHGREAAERAGMPYYQAAGEKFIEAKSQMKHGEFIPWLKREFGISHDQAKRYMNFAETLDGQNPLASGFFSLSDHVRKTSNPNYNMPQTVRPPAYHEEVKQIVGRVDTETLNLKREDMKRQEERDAQRKLGLQLIDIGFKVLARTLHPDKGGSREAMSRLNAVRERLKQCV